MNNPKSKDLSREEIFEQVIKVAVENGCTSSGTYNKTCVTEGRTIFDNNMGDHWFYYDGLLVESSYNVDPDFCHIFGMISFEKLITSKVFITAIAKYLLQKRRGNYIYLSDNVFNDDVFVMFSKNDTEQECIEIISDRITKDQALAIRDNKLVEFYRQIIGR